MRQRDARKIVCKSFKNENPVEASSFAAVSGVVMIVGENDSVLYIHRKLDIHRLKTCCEICLKNEVI